jgi:cell division protein FtsQ
MSGEFIFSEDVLPVKPAVPRNLGKNLKRLIIIALVILGGEGIWVFVVSPCIPFSTVEVNAFPGLDREAALALGGIGERASFMTVNAGAVEKALEGHCLVASARVTKHFPDRLRIYLEPRRAVAFSLAAVSGRVLPVYFDREGVIFQIGNRDETPVPPDLPILSGLVFEQPVPGMRLPATFNSLLADLGNIADRSPELLEAVSEIRINRKPFDGFDLILYPLHNPVRVRLNEMTEENLRYVMLMLDVFTSWDTQPEEIDFRSSLASYTAKEAPSGE